MDDYDGLVPPGRLAAIVAASLEVGFFRASEFLVGGLLRTLAASKGGGRLLELGTGTGVGTAWLLDGMGTAARLVSVERDAATQAVARRILGDDPRVQFVTGDGEAFLRGEPPGSYDLVFADGGPGKFTHLDLALTLLRPGGIYVADNLFPHLFHPAGRHARVREFLATLTSRSDLVVSRLGWSSGVVVCARRAPSG